MSYPKPPVLNVKWANRDINVIEWVNIPKFSMLDNLVTPLRLVKLFFFDILVEKNAPIFKHATSYWVPKASRP